jgi:cell division septation protein DedD
MSFVAEDEYYYQIELTNKKLIFYFVAGAFALILSFLAGVMVGRGVDNPRNAVAEAARQEERIVPESSPDGVVAPSASPEDLTYSERLESDKAEDSLERAPSSIPATPRPRPSASPRPTPTPRTAAVTAESTSVRRGTFAVQVGAFQDRAAAESVAGRLKGRGFPAFVSPGGVAGLFNVRVGSYSARPEAERVRDTLRDNERLKPFIVTN